METSENNLLNKVLFLVVVVFLSFQISIKPVLHAKLLLAQLS